MSTEAEAQTAAYIDALGTDLLAEAAAYTVGNHWLLLANLVVAGLSAWLFVRSNILGRLNQRLDQRARTLRILLMTGSYFLGAALIALPLTIYAGWWRELLYHRTSQAFPDFLGQTLLGILISVLLGAVFMTLVYELMRRVGKLWWAWSGLVTALVLSGLLLVSPFVLEPLFNQYQPLPAGQVQNELRKLAAQAEIPMERIFIFDGSRQSNNFTANVSGFGASARIAISDVALSSATLDEVKAVTAHEIGHYDQGHIGFAVLLSAVLAIIFFYSSARWFATFARFFKLDSPIENPLGLPVLMFMVSLFGLLLEPVTNSLGRAQELAADNYSLEQVGLPDALAGALVKTAAYRDPRPHPLQELFFYTHPSVERRILNAMQWKSVHISGGS